MSSCDQYKAVAGSRQGGGERRGAGKGGGEWRWAAARRRSKGRRDRRAPQGGGGKSGEKVGWVQGGLPVWVVLRFGLVLRFRFGMDENTQHRTEMGSVVLLSLQIDSVLVVWI